MPEMMEYRFKKDGSCIGRVSGTPTRWQEGQTKRLPKGELQGVPSRFYETRPLEPSKSDPEEDAQESEGGSYETREEGSGEDTPDEEAEGRFYETSGSWKNFYVGDEHVGNAQCSKEEAEAWSRGEKTLDMIK